MRYKVIIAPLFFSKKHTRCVVTFCNVTTYHIPAATIIGLSDATIRYLVFNHCDGLLYIASIIMYDVF